MLEKANEGFVTATATLSSGRPHQFELCQSVHHAGDAQAGAGGTDQEVSTVRLAAVLFFAEKDVHDEFSMRCF
jgi:hypothetical protein